MKCHLVLIAATMLLVAYSVQAQNWEWWRMDQGGVVRDLQFVYHDNATDPKDQVWAAVMNTGLYRSTWDTTNHLWDDWTEHKPSIKGYGVDAIEVEGVEHVLGAGVF